MNWKKKIMKQRVQIKVNISLKDFFADLSSAVVHGLSGQWGDMIASLANIIKSVGLKDNVEIASYKLVIDSMARAIFNLIKDSNFELFSADTIKEAHNLSESFGLIGFDLDNNLLDNPKSCSFVKDMQTILRLWLQDWNVERCKINNTVNRLPSYFVFSLNSEWRRKPELYRPITDYFLTPFSEQERREYDWRTYRAYLEKRINESVYGAVYSLKDIYIPLNCYIKKGKDSYEHFDLFTYIDRWLKQYENDKIENTMLYIGGLPGSGKSSSALMFAHKYSESYDILFIQLHLLDTSLNFKESIYQCILPFFSKNPIDYSNNLILILDGLDELIYHDCTISEAANSLIETVKQFVDTRNQNGIKIRTIITGRELIIQNCYAHIARATVVFLDPYSDELKNAWWTNVGNLMGIHITKVPDKLCNNKLNDLTYQPLHNYLVALSYFRGKIDFSTVININMIFYDILSAVYERAYAPEGKISSMTNYTETQFFQFLEEISVVVWHNTGRDFTISEIEEHFNLCKISLHIKPNQIELQNSIMNIMLAFYFRQRGQRGELERTFEFTHKRFVEYLLARRFVRQTIMSQQIESYSVEARSDLLLSWLLLFGGTALDEDKFEYIKDEFEVIGEDKIDELFKTLCFLINDVMQNGWPFEHLKKRPSYSEERKQAKNAEIALFVLFCACAKVWAKKKTVYIWSKEKFAEWVTSILIDDAFVKKYLNELNFDYYDLAGINFNSCNLQGTSFDHANLEYANLVKANMKMADLENANMDKSHMEGVILDNANLDHTHMHYAQIKDTSLVECTLKNAQLRFANIYNSSYVHADLSYADLSMATLASSKCCHAKFYKTNLEGADLTSTDFTFAVLNYACLKFAYLYKANFSDADLSMATLASSKCCYAIFNKTNLEGADLSSTDFTFAVLNCACLKFANLYKANFVDADLSEADLRGAVLTETTLVRTNLSKVKMLKKDFEKFDLRSCINIDSIKLFNDGDME